MPSILSSRRAMVLISAALILGGALLGFWALARIPSLFSNDASTARAALIATPAPDDGSGDELLEMAALSTGEPSVSSAESAGAPAAKTLPIGLTVGVSGAVPLSFLNSLSAVVLPGDKSVAVTRQVADKPLTFDWNAAGGTAAYTVTFAAATRFDTIFPEIAWEELQAAWTGASPTWTVVSVLTTTIPALEQTLGPAGALVQGQETITDLVDSVWTSEPVLALVPFDRLAPRLAVLKIDGQTPVENANHFDPAAYPFTATLYAHVAANARREREQIAALLDALPAGNRDPRKLTVLTMTGVTAMVRMMANEMDERGSAWPAEYVGPELASADITHISNEVPFKSDCETDLREENFNFCSKYEYFETLELSGVDIIGLTGNHQNDFGRAAAYESMAFYEERGLPIYGGGRDARAANAPLYVEHNGNRLAFLGANSYGPEMAWADSDWPGSAIFDLNILSANIRAIKEQGKADLVLVELQYQESYDVIPLMDQREDFNALVRAGADIVTGVQSHVPQAMEFTDGKLILYGLGNLYFDQMYQQNTRENLIVKHTLYDGRHISTQVLTTLLYDFGQPRFTTPQERESLLDRIFGASYW